VKNTYKIVTSFAGTLLVISLIVVSFWAFDQTKEAADARKHTFIVIQSANEFLSALINAETGQRGYLLTNDEVFLKPYLAVRDSIGGSLEICVNLPGSMLLINTWTYWLH